jgi:hypothetical protein
VRRPSAYRFYLFAQAALSLPSFTVIGGLHMAREGGRLIRRRPVLLLLVSAAFFAGAYTEGFDRLWEPTFIRDVGLPAFFGLSDLWWFAVLGAGAMLLGLLVSNVLVQRVTDASDASMARLLFVLAVLRDSSGVRGRRPRAGAGARPVRARDASRRPRARGESECVTVRIGLEVLRRGERYG